MGHQTRTRVTGVTSSRELYPYVTVHGTLVLLYVNWLVTVEWVVLRKKVFARLDNFSLKFLKDFVDNIKGKFLKKSSKT